MDTTEAHEAVVTEAQRRQDKELQALLKDKAYLEEVKKQCKASSKKFSKVFFPGRFRLPFSDSPIPGLRLPKEPDKDLPMHDAICSIIDDRTIQKVNIIASRKIGKTSLFQLTAPAQGAVFDFYHYIVPISRTATHSIAQSQSLKKQMQSNSLLRSMFFPTGRIGSEDTKEKWNMEFPELDELGQVILGSDGKPKIEREVIIHPRGNDQQVRGLIEGDFRPDLWLVDDLEDARDSETVRRQKLEWFFGDILGGLSDSDDPYDNWRILNIGNPSNYNSMQEELACDPDWLTIRIPICDDNYKSYWEVMHSTESLKMEYEAFARKKMARVFVRERMCKLVATEEQSFQQEYFENYIPDNEPEGVLRRNHNLISAILVDPANSDDPLDDNTSIVGISFDPKDTRILVRDAIKAHLKPSDQIDEAFRMGDDLGAMYMCVEDAGKKQHIQHPWENACLQRRKNFIVTYLQPRGINKAVRIQWLEPYMRRGEIYFRKSIAHLFLQEGLGFPHSPENHLLDALAYMHQWLQDTLQFFMPEKAKIRGEIVQVAGEKYDKDDKDFMEESYLEHLQGVGAMVGYGEIEGAL